MRSSHTSSGLTLVEVVIALLVLAIGVLGAVGLQASGLTATRTSQEMQRLNAAARSELDVLRGAPMPYTSFQTRSCPTLAEGCTVEIRPCAVVGSDLDCGRGSVAEPAAHAITLVVSEGERSVTLNTVVVAR